MATRYVADRVSHSQDRQAECERDPNEANAELGKCRGQHGGAAAAQNEPTSADKLRYKLAHHHIASRWIRPGRLTSVPMLLRHTAIASTILPGPRSMRIALDQRALPI